MLTFSEALTQLKAGSDMRHATWMAGQFARAVKAADGSLKLVKVPIGSPTTAAAVAALPPYFLTQQEMFSQDWSKA